MIDIRPWSHLPESIHSNIWGNLDEWLVQMARDTTADGGLVLSIVDLVESEVPEAYLPRFKEVGKIITYVRLFPAHTRD
jgi:hypothetical protein